MIQSGLERGKCRHDCTHVRYVGHVARRQDMSLRAETLDPGRSERLSAGFRLVVDFGKMNRHIPLAHQHAIPTDRVRVLMEARPAVAEEGKGLEGDHTGVSHGPR